MKKTVHRLIHAYLGLEFGPDRREGVMGRKEIPIAYLIRQKQPRTGGWKQAPCTMNTNGGKVMFTDRPTK